MECRLCRTAPAEWPDTLTPVSYLPIYVLCGITYGTHNWFWLDDVKGERDGKGDSPQKMHQIWTRNRSMEEAEVDLDFRL
jgi:hypothetical protein